MSETQDIEEQLDDWKHIAHERLVRALFAERALAAKEKELELVQGAVIAMAEDGWLLHGPEGMSDAQKKCLAAYESIHPAEEQSKALCEKCGVDRFTAPCRNPHSPDCPMHGIAFSARKP